MTAQALDAALLLVVGGLLAAAARCDVRALWIPDRYGLGIVLAYGAAALSQPWQAAAAGLATALLVFAGGALLFARGWLGGADVKLLAALALWAGPDGLASLLFDTALAGAVLALAMLVRLRRRTPANWRVHEPLRQPMPFGVAIAAAGWALIVARWSFA
ncbi:MAG: prepilin peptidase [Polymorphobacter sp.]